MTAQITVESIEKAKLEFAKKYVEQILSQKIGINPTVQVANELNYFDDGSRYVLEATLTWGTNLEGSYIKKIDDYFTINRIRVDQERNLVFEVNMPKGLQEAYKQYLEAI